MENAGISRFSMRFYENLTRIMHFQKKDLIFCLTSELQNT